MAYSIIRSRSEGDLHLLYRIVIENISVEPLHTFYESHNTPPYSAKNKRVHFKNIFQLVTPQRINEPWPENSWALPPTTPTESQKA